MLTHGTVGLLTSMPEIEARVLDPGRTLGEYIKSWAAPLDAAYHGIAGPVGERSLVVSLAPGARHSVWVVDPDVGDLADETRFATDAAESIEVPRAVRLPILMSLAFWVGPVAVPVQSFGTRPSFVIPAELVNLGAELAGGGERYSLTAVVDEYWRRKAL